MRPCHFFQRPVGVRGNGRLVSSLFHQCISFCISAGYTINARCYVPTNRVAPPLSIIFNNYSTRARWISNDR